LASGDQMQREFVSYPKSGRTWIRYVLYRLGVENLIRFHHDGCEFSGPVGEPLALDFTARLHRAREAGPIVYLSRDPRDLIVSLYFQITGRMRDIYSFDGDISSFIRDEYFGAGNLYAFHRQWSELCRRGLALHVTYEACHRKLEDVIRQILDWYGLSVANREVRAACESAEFQRMQEVELSGRFEYPWLRPRNGATKTRQGVVGSHAASLPADDIAYLNRLFAPDEATE
jgi:hypothetical protein